MKWRRSSPSPTKEAIEREMEKKQSKSDQEGDRTCEMEKEQSKCDRARERKGNKGTLHQ